MFLGIIQYLFIFFNKKNTIFKNNIHNSHSIKKLFSNLIEDNLSSLENIIELANNSTRKYQKLYLENSPGTCPKMYEDNNSILLDFKINNFFIIKKKIDYLNNDKISLYIKLELLLSEKPKINKFNITEGGLYYDWDFIM